MLTTLCVMTPIPIEPASVSYVHMILGVLLSKTNEVPEIPVLYIIILPGSFLSKVNTVLQFIPSSPLSSYVTSVLP